MSHVIIADDGTLTLADGATLEDLALPEIPELVQTAVEAQAQDDAPAPTQEQIDAVEEEARTLKEQESAIKKRLETLATVMRRIPKDSDITTVSNLSTPKLIADAVVEAKYPYDAIDSVDEVVTGPRGGKKIVTKLVFPNRHLYKITVDKTAVKKHLGADELADVQVDGTTRVTFK